jgi:hypothetical protein
MAHACELTIFQFGYTCRQLGVNVVRWLQNIGHAKRVEYPVLCQFLLDLLFRIPICSMTKYSLATDDFAAVLSALNILYSTCLR